MEQKNKEFWVGIVNLYRNAGNAVFLTVVVVLVGTMLYVLGAAVTGFMLVLITGENPEIVFQHPLSIIGGLTVLIAGTIYLYATWQAEM